MTIPGFSERDREIDRERENERKKMLRPCAVDGGFYNGTFNDTRQSFVVGQSI